jgi:D-threo-aldose 1-dehydrogenase
MDLRGPMGEDAAMTTQAPSPAVCPEPASAPQPGATVVAGRVRLPPVVFGISALGNLYRALPAATKRAIVAESRRWTAGAAVFDGAGKYGAGLALEELGRALRADGAANHEVLISNKLGWRRVPLTAAEPTFEPGAWVDLAHDAVQDISYEGILRCWEEGDALLGAPYRSRLVSVHDPDEYLAAAGADAQARARRMADIAGAYQALFELRAQGTVAAVGIGAKNWQVARDIVARARGGVDWVMLACSLTVFSHPLELVAWVAELARQGVAVIDSALFHGGFLLGGDFFDYRRVDPDDAAGKRLCAWRQRFGAVCADHGVAPAHACVAFARLVPGVASVALNTADPARVASNLALATTPVAPALWRDLADRGLIDRRLGFLP